MSTVYTIQLKERLHLNFNAVGIWSDMLGGIYLWGSSLCWHLCPDSTDCSEERRETGQTQQCCLHKWNVNVFREVNIIHTDFEESVHAFMNFASTLPLILILVYTCMHYYTHAVIHLAYPFRDHTFPLKQ